VKKAAIELGVSEKTVRRRIDAGEIRHRRVGKLIRIPASEVEDQTERIPQEA
jgi:excisionase family DNA binding protein